MKRYKIEYFQGDRSKLSCITELSKSGKRDGTRIVFLSDGRKGWQDNWKNDLLNGIDKDWWLHNKKIMFS